MSALLDNKSLKFSGVDMVPQPADDKSTPETELTKEQVLRMLISKLKQVIKQAVARARQMSSSEPVVRKQVTKTPSEPPAGQQFPPDDDQVLYVDPISYNVPVDYDPSVPFNYEGLRLALMPVKKRKRERADLIGSMWTSFKLPDEFLNYAMALKKANVEEIQDQDFSFKQRLDGWRIQRKRRTNGRCDMYFSHARSKGSFRSVIEVVNFIMRETYPRKPFIIANKSASEHDMPSGEKTSLKRRRRRRSLEIVPYNNNESSNTAIHRGNNNNNNNKISAKHKKMVEEFLVASWRNMGQHSWDESDGWSDHDEEEGQENVVDFLAAAYDNLQSKQIPKKPQGNKRRKRSEKPIIIRENGKRTPVADSLAFQVKNKVPESTQVPTAGEPVVRQVSGLLLPEELQRDLESFPDPPEMMAVEIDPSKVEEQYDLINHIKTCDIEEFNSFLGKKKPQVIINLDD